MNHASLSHQSQSARQDHDASRHPIQFRRPWSYLHRTGRVGHIVALSLAIGSSTLAPAIAAPSVLQPNLTQVTEGDGYVLGPGDRVRIDFFSVPEFSTEYPVLPNGTVNLPQVGAVSVQGRTLKQASNAISDRYRDVLTRPTVTMSLVSARPIQVAIGGEVNRPGSYMLPPTPTGATAEGNIPSLTRTLQLAEGVTQAADLSRVQIRRVRPNGTGAIDVTTVNLWELLKTGNVQQDLRLRDGDSIFIPASTSVNLEEARQLTSANFATQSSRPLKISVVGQVNRPGPYTITGNTNSSSPGVNGTQTSTTVNNTVQVPTVTQAIQLAGGITQTADLRSIQIRRLTRTGPAQIVKVDMWKLFKSGDVLQDLPLQDGDTIEIPTATALNEQEIAELATASFSPDRISINVVGEVEKPGPVVVPPNTPLNQALLAAGGFNRRARKSNVTLVRLNPNGTVTKRDISIDLAEGINDQKNPALRNNDIVIVRKNFIAGVSDVVGSVTAPFNGFFGLLRLFGL